MPRCKLASLKSSKKRASRCAATVSNRRASLPHTKKTSPAARSNTIKSHDRRRQRRRHVAALRLRRVAGADALLRRHGRARPAQRARGARRPKQRAAAPRRRRPARGRLARAEPAGDHRRARRLERPRQLAVVAVPVVGGEARPRAPPGAPEAARGARRARPVLGRVARREPDEALHRRGEGAPRGLERRRREHGGGARRRGAAGGLHGRPAAEPRPARAAAAAAERRRRVPRRSRGRSGLPVAAAAAAAARGKTAVRVAPPEQHAVAHEVVARQAPEERADVAGPFSGACSLLEKPSFNT